MYRSILNERSPYAWKTTDPRLPNTGGLWSWSTVLKLLERFEATGELQALPLDVQMARGPHRPCCRTRGRTTRTHVV